MQRIFFNESLSVNNTEGNRILGNFLTLLERVLTNVFNTVGIKKYTSFSEWTEIARRQQPKMAYLLEWIKHDSALLDVYQMELENAIDDKLLDEFNVATHILNNIKLTEDKQVLCSDVADAIYFLCIALKENRHNQDVAQFV